MAKPTPSTSLSSHSHPPRSNLASSPSSLSPRHVIIPATRPSSTVLAVLAAVAASSSTADGRPLSTDSQPLDFLCPILASDTSDAACSSKAKSNEPDVDPRVFYLSPTPTRNKRRPRTFGYVPDKFEKGDDGLWRRETSWSLYGSTHCECEDLTAPATAVPQVDDQIDPSQITSQDSTTTTSSSSATTSTDMTANLPPGWEGSSSKDVPAYILVLSILLAILIFGTIFGCVGWRRKRRALARMDHEKRLRKQMKEEYDSDVEPEVRQARTQQKLWAKASAKWRSGIRISIRKRRRRTPFQVVQDPEPRRSVDTLVSSVSEVASTTSARSVGNGGPNQSDITPRPSSSSRDGNSSRDSPHCAAGESTDASRPSHPPQYPQDMIPTPYGQLTNVDRPSIPDASRPSVAEASTVSPVQPLRDDLDIPYTAPTGGHVATDDKTVLARMVEFASAPPVSDDAPHGASHVGSHDLAGPSVPGIEELEQGAVELLDVDEAQPSYSENRRWDRSVLSDPYFSPSGLPSSLTIHTPAPIYSREPSPRPDTRCPPPPPAFPPPPTKAQLFYEYPSAFEADVQGTEPEALPSAPPFEFVSGPSAPPEDAFDPQDPDAEACAPPLIDEDEATQLGLCAPASSLGSSSWPAVAGSSLEEGGRHQDQAAEHHTRPLGEPSDASRPSTSAEENETAFATSSHSRLRAASPPGYLP